MKFVKVLAAGFGIADRHRRLIAVLWLAPLVPAVLLTALAAANVLPALGPSLYAQRILWGDWFVVWSEFRSSPLDALAPILGPGIALMALLSLGLQLLLAAGIVEVVLERRREHPFVLGLRANLPSFARTLALLLLGTLVAGAAAAAVVRGFFKLAEAQADGRLDLVGVTAGALVFFVLWAPQMLAADLSRIAAARHDQRAMARGYLRGLGAVIRRPGLFLPLAAAFVLLPLALNLGYLLLRSPWTPGNAAALLGLVLVQQVVMVLRAALELGFWGAGVAAFRELGEPELCRPRPARVRAAPATGPPAAAAGGDPVAWSPEI